MRNINHIIIHHSATPQTGDNAAVLKSIDQNHAARLHRTKNSLGYHIAYHAVVMPDGTLVQTRDSSEIGYHAGHWETNIRSLGICIIGNYQEEEPTLMALMALKKQIQSWQEAFGIGHILPHRAIKATGCPGKWFDEGVIQILSTPCPEWAIQGVCAGLLQGLIQQRDIQKPLTMAEFQTLLHEAGILHRDEESGITLMRALTMMTRMTGTGLS